MKHQPYGIYQIFLAKSRRSGIQSEDMFEVFGNLKELITTVSYAGLFGIVFAESGLLIGFFFPGDSLLFTAGILASQQILNIYLLIPLLAIAAIAGDSAGYTFGKKVGKRIFNKEDSLFFHKDHLRKANEFYQKHGGKTIILARFMPLIRTFAPIIAGVGEMEYRKFLFYNIFGGVFWVISMTVGGFFLGNIIPDIDKYLLPILAAIIMASVLPGFIHFYRENKVFLKERILSLVKNKA